MTMEIPRPCQHGSLPTWQEPIPETPGMHPKLLPVQVPNLEHPMSGKERISMVAPPHACHQAHNPLLVPEERPSKGPISPTLKAGHCISVMHFYSVPDEEEDEFFDLLLHNA